LRKKDAEAAAAKESFLASKAERDKIAKEKEETAKRAAEEAAAVEESRRVEREARRAEAAARKADLSAIVKPTGKLPPQKKIFGMWVNDKLVKGGYEPIKVGELELEMQDGTVVAKLLQVLTEHKIEGIDWQPNNPLKISSNFYILWSVMKAAGMELGSVNATNIMRDPPVLKTDLGLLWALICKFELDDANGSVSALLAWVQPRTAAMKKVDDLANDWKDGLAFLALLDSLCPGKVNWGEVKSMTPAQRLEMAFKLNLVELGVPKLLDPEDLEGPGDVEMKQSVMTYIAAIKNAAAKQGSGADKLFDDANALYVQALLDGRTKEDDLFHTARDAIKDCVYGDNNKVDDIIAEAINGLDATNESFIPPIDKFGQAQEQFEAFKTEEGAEKADACKAKAAEARRQPEILRTRLQEGLIEEKNRWLVKVEIEEGDMIISEVDELMDGLTSQIQTWAADEIAKCSGEDERYELKNKAKAIVQMKAQPLIAAKEHYQIAHGLNTDVPVKLQLLNKIAAVDDIIDDYEQRVVNLVNSAIFKADEDKAADTEDILRIYHEFSKKIDSLQKKMELEDIDVPRAPGMAETRLAGIMAAIDIDYQRDITLREKLHIALDETFTIEKLP